MHGCIRCRKISCISRSLVMFKYNLFLFKDLPSAWLCGVRVRVLNDKKCIITVKHNWFNSNPFKSLYWAVQGMASELATGLAIIDFANKNSLNISMLVVSNESVPKDVSKHIETEFPGSPMIQVRENPYCFIDKEKYTQQGLMITKLILLLREHMNITLVGITMLRIILIRIKKEF